MDLTRKALVSASRKLARLGLTSLHCIVSSLTELNALRDLKREKKIPQSIYPIIPPKLVDSLEASYLSDAKSENTLQVRGLKLYLDGFLGARTAALNEPYNDTPSASGMLTLSNHELTQLVSHATA